MTYWNPQYKTLDHWRGIAALWVMLFHGFGTTFDKSLHPLVEIIKSIAAPGWLGVHIFFVISGYCITASVYKLILKGGSSWAFLQTRILRLMPTYWIAFLLTLSLNIISSPFNKVNLADAIPSSWEIWFGNLFLIQPYLNVPFYVVVYWSLVVEIGFYLIVATLLIIRNKISQNLSLFLGLFLAFMAIFMPHDSKLGWIRYWSEFVCGSLVFTALFAKHKNHTYHQNLSITLIMILGATGAWIHLIHDQNQLWFSSIFAIIIYLLYGFDNIINSINLINWLKYFGLISYSLYLLHVPFQGRVVNLGTRFIPVDSIMILVLQVLGWAVAITISIIFFKLVEKPLNNWRYQQRIAKL
ncbi:hypothetical protein ACX27_18205 [Nostoc piscinale CENA21]|uniref:Acyltransferase 3 domain-containing protein n=1 Tax=Nostoc piscinale CENA21 TaxID=224013 RepID=A0A0M4TLY5_9NOSO|nr:acyltransferase [Nostoc piscinale]ALF54336.1 hypothetical protein ACX27_18205 [Nostoc piscinale CENA21]